MTSFPTARRSWKRCGPGSSAMSARSSRRTWRCWTTPSGEVPTPSATPCTRTATDSTRSTPTGWAARPVPGIKERRIRLEILTLGRDFATVNLEFKVRGRDLVGRQSQTWVRFPDLGWKVVSAHVSTVNEEPLW